MSEKIKIVGVIASEHGATLITIDGKSIELKSTDYRTHKLIEQITPIIAKHKVAEVDLNSFDATKVVEEKTEGKIKFFRVLTSKLKGLFGRSAERDIKGTHDYGMISNPVAEKAAKQEGVKTLTDAQVENLKAEDRGIGSMEPTTLVAVVDNTPIIGAEALEKQIEVAAKTEGRPVGFEKFMERLAAVARERKHTAQELLAFIEKADLPIADDGSIIGYKALKVGKKDGVRTFYDHHTGKVPQRVGSKVQMPVEKVDDNRRVLCSNGLHIARRKYLTGYGSQGTITLAKIAPEDVISVPFGEPDKMRCAAYHIIAELPESAHAFIRSNQPMTKNAEAAAILGNMIKGNHIGVIETVEIGGPSGTNIKVTKTGESVAEVAVDQTVTAKVLDDELANKLNPAALNKQVEQILSEQKADPIAEAASTGDLAAALTTSLPAADPTPVKADDKPKVVKIDAATRKKLEKLTEDKSKRDAVIAVLGGMSKREAERKFEVSTRTIGRLIDKLAA